MLGHAGKGSPVAILIEAYTVIMRKATIAEKYPGGLEQYRQDHNPLEDDHLAALLFMNPAGVRKFISWLEGYGFQYVVDDRSVDIVVVDMFDGPIRPCGWVGFEIEKEQSRTHDLLMSWFTRSSSRPATKFA